MPKKAGKIAKKEAKKSFVKKTKEKKLPEKKEPPKKVTEEKPENLEEKIEEAEEAISDSGFREFFQPTKKSAPVLERVAIQGDVELENKIAGIPARRERRKERNVNYSETKQDYDVAKNVERRENPENMGYVGKTATYNSIQKKEETGTAPVNAVKSEWGTRRRTDRAEMELGSFERIEKEKRDKKYVEKGASEYYR